MSLQLLRWKPYTMLHRMSSAAMYHSRAHPRPIIEVPIPIAVDRLLQNCEKRIKVNQKTDIRLQAIAEKKGKKKRTQRGYPDETVELALNLNLDPRKPGQSIRGSLELPHGTGKKGQSVIVFTTDEALAERAKAEGASHVGGEELVNEILNGTVSPGAFQVALATLDMISVLQKKGAARILGPRGLMPNAKTGTAVESADALIAQLQNQIAAKQVEFRTEKEGSVHLPVGKRSFGARKLLENIGAIMTAIYEVKPEAYGKGKKTAKKTSKQQPKYLLSAFVSSTQGKGIKLDVRTVDPSSPFFLSDTDPLVLAANKTSETQIAASEPQVAASGPQVVASEPQVAPPMA